jgi:hypothetical protein
MSQYIYLLQEREFIKTNESIYKVGMTQKENYERFNQYPKGSMLLFQMICNDCKYIEKQVLQMFKRKFKQRKDIGNEYFEGNYKYMIDIIYITIKNENCEDKTTTCNEEENDIECESEENENDIKETNNPEEETHETYEITTYEEWIKYNNIDNIVIKNKKGEGYLRFKGQLWREFYDNDCFEFNEHYMENLYGFIKCNQPNLIKMVSPICELVHMNEMINIVNNETKFIEVNYNIESICKDIIKKCYSKNIEFYKLQYSEYAIMVYKQEPGVNYAIFNSIDFTFTHVDELISNKILTTNNGGSRFLQIKNMPNISIIDDILNSLVDKNTKCQYKKLVYNILVKQEENQIIFYDYNECLLTTWIRDLLYLISNTKYYICDECNSSELKQILKKTKPRCIIIYNSSKINHYTKLGFRNIIVCEKTSKKSTYNMSTYIKYLQDNKEKIIKMYK